MSAEANGEQGASATAQNGDQPAPSDQHQQHTKVDKITALQDGIGKEPFFSKTTLPKLLLTSPFVFAFFK
jgi:hypothetical protein